MTYVDVLKEFVNMRKLIKRPMTPYAIKLIEGKLDSLADTDKERIAILNQSILNNWQGVYALKEDDSNFDGESVKIR